LLIAKKSTSSATTTKAANSDHIRGLPMDSINALSNGCVALAHPRWCLKALEWSG
jgi:hypothetical protein